MPISEAPYSVIAADPGWTFNDKLRMSKVKRGADDNYKKVMPLADIAALLRDSPIRAKDSVLALWVPSSMFPDGFTVMREWGYTFKQIYTWVKTTKNLKIAMGMGHIFRGCTEHALIGVRGHPKRLNKGQRNLDIEFADEDDPLDGGYIDFAQMLFHSAKPETLQSRLDILYGGSKLELFARRDREGWECVGNENPSTKDIDIKDWLSVVTNSLSKGKAMSTNRTVTR